ncbi:MAG: hypothetical protein ACLT3U_15245 [Neglectibacter timonensis]
MRFLCQSVRILQSLWPLSFPAAQSLLKQFLTA